MRSPRSAVRLAAAAAALPLCLAATAARAQAGAPSPPPALRPSAAAALPPSRCSIPRGQSWREYRSPHFVLSTDVEPSRAAALVQQLEQLHAYVVAALFGPDVEIPGRVRAVAFASFGQYQEVAPEGAAGYVKRDGWEATVVFPFEGLAPVGATIAHELAHDVAWRHFPRQPSWFAEGLAMFVQTVADVRSDERGAATGSHLVRGEREHFGHWAGYLSPELERFLGSSLAVSAKELLEWRGDAEGDTRFHTRSWLLYHYLWNKRSKAFTDFQERLSNGDDPAAAWRAAFPDLDPASSEAMSRLDGELAAYRRSGRYASYRVDIGAVDASFRDSAIPSADVHMLLQRVRAVARRDDDRATQAARASLEEALREDPRQPEAVAERARAAGASVAAALRPVTVARPDDARAWLELADVLHDPADAKEREAALRKAASLGPELARANADLAWLLATTGRAREARPFAERAVDLAPWNGGAVFTLARVALELGQCKPALILGRRAADAFPAGNAEGDRVREQVAEWSRRCSAK